MTTNQTVGDFDPLNLPSTSSQNISKPESLRKKASRLFMYQQTHKVELPIPPTPTQCKAKRVNNSKINRKAKAATIADSNRNLYSFGFTKGSRSSESQNPVVSGTAGGNTSSIIKDQTDKLNAEIAENMMNISKIKENFNNEIKSIVDLSDKKASDAIQKLCALVQSNNDKMCALQETTQQNLLKLLALQKDLELSNVRRDALIGSNADKIQTIETKMACSRDLHKVWITFTCDKELEELKKSENLILETKDILKRMDIDIDRLGMLPIRSANFQHIKVNNGIVPTLCVSFANDKIASIVRRKMMKYNAMLDDENRLSELRYSERIFWSTDVWKILKICWELKRLKLVEYVNVHAEGIRVQYSIKSDIGSANKSASMNVTSFVDIDKLRAIVGDIFPEVKCCMLYDNDYFKMNFAKRDKKRSSNYVEDSDDNDEQEGMDC